MTKKNIVYLDHAASTPIYTEIEQEWDKIKKDCFGNPSSIHSVGRSSRKIIDDARYSAAKIFDITPAQVVFTSGGTESMHLAIIGGFLGKETKKNKILVTPFGHSCINNSVAFLEKHFGIEVVYMPITEEGFIDTNKLIPEYLEKFDLVITEHGNSETGHLQKVAEIGESIQQCLTNPIFIVDCSASFVSEEFIFKNLKTDFLILSGEKFGGASGTGILIKEKNIKLCPLQSGSQEFGYRGGTENISGIFSIARALELHTEKRDALVKKWTTFHEFLRKELESKYKITTPKQGYLPHIFHFQLPSSTGHDLVVQADLKNICISSGSACSSGNTEGSKILKNMGYNIEEAKRGVRVSFGRETTKEDLEKLLEVVLDQI